MRVDVCDVSRAPPVYDVVVEDDGCGGGGVDVKVVGSDGRERVVGRGVGVGGRVCVDGTVCGSERVEIVGSCCGVRSCGVGVVGVCAGGRVLDLRSKSVAQVDGVLNSMSEIRATGILPFGAVLLSGASVDAHGSGFRSAGICVVSRVARPGVVVEGVSGRRGTCAADAWVEAVTSVGDGAVTQTDVRVVDVGVSSSDGGGDGGSGGGGDGVGVGAVTVSGRGTSRVRLGGVSGGRVCVVRARVWRGGEVSGWSSGVEVTTVAPAELPLAGCDAITCCACDCGFRECAVGRASDDRCDQQLPPECTCCGR